ncbi:MAG: hypothetical protein AAFQ12_07845 [Pseudomonadota bacterium]
MNSTSKLLTPKAFLLLSFMATVAGQGAVMADGVLASQSEDQLKLSVEISEAPKLIAISGLEDIVIEKTVGDGPVNNLETTACVYMQGGDTYSLQIIADPLTSEGQHYPYKLVVDQNSASGPSATLDVSNAQAGTTVPGFIASLNDSCLSQPKLFVRVTDVGSDAITGAFSAEAMKPGTVVPA